MEDNGEWEGAVVQMLYHETYLSVNFEGILVHLSRCEVYNDNFPANMHAAICIM